MRIAREFADQVRRIDVDQADNAVVGLEGHGDHAADFLLHDAHVLAQSLIELRVANQQRFFLAQHTLANGGRDLKTIAAGGTHLEFIAF